MSVIDIGLVFLIAHKGRHISGNEQIKDQVFGAKCEK
jgi:hypothetical protein